jgi:phosphatidylserine/phosphatidylglycerophosphate/cardiolipin synthase-like enzyme
MMPRLPIVTQIRSARKSVDVLAYLLTNDAIASELLAKAKAGVIVRVVLDAREAKAGGVAPSLVAPVQVRVDHRHAIMHNKVLIVDGVRVLTGSYNYTSAAENMNAENLIGVGAKAAGAYEVEFGKHWVHAQ